MDDNVRLRRPCRAGGVLVPGPRLRGRRAARGVRDVGTLASVGVPPEEWGDGAYIEDPAGLRPAISVLKVPEAKTAKNRVHLDVQAGGGRGQPQDVRWARVQEAVARLTGAGATVVREDRQDGVPDHFVMADPEGNEFCVL